MVVADEVKYEYLLNFFEFWLRCMFISLHLYLVPYQECLPQWISLLLVYVPPWYSNGLCW